MGIFVEIRQGFRRLARTPLLAAVLILTLGIVIGAGASVAELLNRIVLHPFSYAQPDELVQLRATMPKLGIDRMAVSPTDLLDFGEIDHFERLLAVRRATFHLTGDGEPEELTGAQASGDPLALFGLEAIRGRGFSTEEISSGAQVALVGEDLWRRRYAGDPQLVGSEIRLDDQALTVIGVVPRELWYPVDAEVWTPLSLVYDDAQRGSRYLTVIARLRRADGLEPARERLASLAASLAEEHPQTNNGVGVIAVPLAQQLRSESGPTVVFAVASLVVLLLIAAATIANTLAARGAERRREMAVRVACGAGALPLARLLLIDNTLLCVLGGTLGVTLAVQGSHVLAALDPESFGNGDAGPGVASLAVAGLLISLLLATAVALILWLQTLWHNWSAALREGAQSDSLPQARLKQAFLVTQVSLCLVLLVGCGLLLVTLHNLRDVDPGFRTQDGVTFRLTPPAYRYATSPARLALFDQVLDGARKLPMLQSVGAASQLPLTGWLPTSSFRIEGRPEPDAASQLRAGLRIVSHDYFSAMGIPVMGGRSFNAGDRRGAPPVVVVNQVMASRFWPDGSALGEFLTIGGREETELYGDVVVRRVVGIVGNVRGESLSGGPEPEMYLPIHQAPPRDLYLVARTEGAPLAALSPLRELVARIDPKQPIAEVRTLDGVVAASIQQTTFQTLVLSCFGAISVLLTMLTVYGVVSHSVIRRRREVGIRMAFGAQHRNVIQMIVSRTAVLVLWGIGIGTGLTFAFMGLASSLLFGISATDPEVYVTVIVLLFALSMLASWLPARRITRVHPAEALRME